MTITRINPQEWNNPIAIIETSVERNVAVSSDVWPNALNICDKNGSIIGYLRGQFLTGGNEGVQLETLRNVNGSNYYNGLRMDINASGTSRVYVNQPAAWRNGLGIGQTTISGWRVTRLPNGLVECRKNFTTTTSYGAWGAFFEHLAVNNQTYPFTFLEIPSVKCEFVVCSGGVIGFEYIAGSTTASPRVYVLRPNKADGQSLTVTLIATGPTNASIGV